MRRFLSILACAVLLPGMAVAQFDPPGADPAPPGQSLELPDGPEIGTADPLDGAPSEPTALDRLFDRLAAAKDAGEAKGIAMLIERRLVRSGSATADLLMSRAQEATQAENHALGIELLDRVLVLQPNWAEAWNRRAASFHMLDDPIAAIADLNRALTLEPRHFSAWAGLGHMLRASGDDEAALAAYERALKINPHMERLNELVERLRRQVGGVDL